MIFNSTLCCWSELNDDMNYKVLFQEFERRKEELDKMKNQLELDYSKFVKLNRKLIREAISKKGTIVKYTGEPKFTYDNEQWVYLKITNNSIQSKPGYGRLIPSIGVMPLDEDLKELKGYNEYVAIDEFEYTSNSKQNLKESIGFVYLINVLDTDIYKIGYSRHSSKRIDSIKTASPLELKVIKIFKCFKAYSVEQELHKLFKDKKKNREWFQLTANDISTLNIFIEEFLIESSHDFRDDVQEQKDYPDWVDQYEIQKQELLEDYEDLREKYVLENKRYCIGDTLTNHDDKKFIVNQIGLWDKLESTSKDPTITYGGFEVLSSGHNSKKFTSFIIPKDEKTILNSNYNSKALYKGKQEILKKYSRLKQQIIKENSEFKKGDMVVDIFDEKYRISEIDYLDSIDWKFKGYFIYSGFKILKSGKLSKKYNHLHKVKKVE